MIEEELVTEVTKIVTETRGRREAVLDIVASNHSVIGVGFGASNTRIVVANLFGSSKRAEEQPTPIRTALTQLVEWLAETLHRVADEHWSKVIQTCIGLPGAVNKRNSSVSNVLNLPQITNGFFVLVEEKIGNSTEFDNDANYAFLGEQHYGVARNARDTVMLTLGAGLCVALSVSSRADNGERGLAGEFGQLPVGQNGFVLERFVTGVGIVVQVAQYGMVLRSPRELLAPDPNPRLTSIREEFDCALLIVLVVSTVSCYLWVLVLGGGIASALVDTLTIYQQNFEDILWTTPQLVLMELGDYSGAAGAVVAAIQGQYQRLGLMSEFIFGLPRRNSLTLCAIRSGQLQSQVN